jgi:hypothetical protein
VAGLIASAALFASAGATSVNLSVDQCAGAGYSYYAFTIGGTETFASDPTCLRVLLYSYWSPDGIGGWITYPQQQADHDISDSQSFDTPTCSAHELVHGFNGSGSQQTCASS